uniref:Uncharacterized protein n=1 Tax=Corethron hystrix TaxID=216773 RepID=A0A7S1FKY8_9STRA|mmetsp:Transcript_10249/g.22752  ORF Transcript_10249/g.22752 Transcript_10249/m.22752 type:complete len:208 (+) Transcript_10249:206-829(+)
MNGKLLLRQILDQKLGACTTCLQKKKRMIFISAQGTLPGTGSRIGAVGTYKPRSQTCSNGCGLKADNVKCGKLATSVVQGPVCNSGVGNNKCVNDPNYKFQGKGCSWFGQVASTRCKLGAARKKCLKSCSAKCNGEVACESTPKKNKPNCLKVGCCDWSGGSCWSNVGTGVCPMAAAKNNTDLSKLDSVLDSNILVVTMNSTVAPSP